MSSAEKTQSGKYRVRVYDYTDSEGKKHYKSFTASTKREANRLAQEYKEGPRVADLTVGEAVRGYIEVKKAALSPSTAREYKMTYEQYFKSSRFGAGKLSSLTTVSMQRFISDQAEAGREPKTVRNVYGLLSSAVRMYRPGVVFNVTLPAPKKPKLYTPTTDEVSRMIASVKKDRELYVTVLLCAFGPLRRSEVCGLKYEDVNYKDNSVTVCRARVMNEDGGWIYKDLPKTFSSYRTISLPEEVINAIGHGFGYVISKSTPNNLTDRFIDARDRVGLPHFRLHDLRHYSASILHAIGIPDQYIMSRGGWKTDNVMKRVYRDTLSDVEKDMNKRINEHFAKAINEN